MVHVIGYHLLFDVPDLSSGLSFEQMVGFSMVLYIVYLVSLAVRAR